MRRPSERCRRWRLRALHASIALLLAVGRVAAADGPAEPLTPAPVDRGPITSSALERRLAAFEKADAAKPPTPGGILFLGSSTIEKWGRTLATDFPDLPVAQRGIGGCTLEQVAGYARRVATPFQPKTVVLYAGENDLAGKSTPPQVVASFTRTVAELRAVVPQARLLFLSIKPSPKRAARQDVFAEANRLLAAACVAQRVEYVDITPVLRDAAGEVDRTLFVRDLLHLNAEGYARLAGVLGPLLAGGRPEAAAPPPAGGAAPAGGRSGAAAGP